MLLDTPSLLRLRHVCCGVKWRKFKMKFLLTKGINVDSFRELLRTRMAVTMAMMLNTVTFMFLGLVLLDRVTPQPFPAL